MMVKRDLNDSVIVVTGAASGMGAAIAKRFAQEGCRVVVSDRRKDNLDEISTEIKQNEGTVLAIPCDVTDISQIDILVNKTLETFEQIDVMVNNAGLGVAKEFHDSSIEEIDRQIDVNFRGLCYGSHAVLEHMINRNSGHIVNIGSMASLRHFGSFAVYTGTKHAVLGFSRALYEEVRDKGIRVSVLCPGFVNTPFFDVAGLKDVPWKQEDMIQAEDIAELVLTCVQMPKNIQIDSMVIWPTCQDT